MSMPKPGGTQGRGLGRGCWTRKTHSQSPVGRSDSPSDGAPSARSESADNQCSDINIERHSQRKSTDENKGKSVEARTRNKRPEIQVYVPRAKRLQQQEVRASSTERERDYEIDHSHDFALPAEIENPKDTSLDVESITQSCNSVTHGSTDSKRNTSPNHECQVNKIPSKTTSKKSKTSAITYVPPHHRAYSMPVSSQCKEQTLQLSSRFTNDKENVSTCSTSSTKSPSAVVRSKIKRVKMTGSGLDISSNAENDHTSSNQTGRCSPVQDSLKDGDLSTGVESCSPNDLTVSSSCHSDLPLGKSESDKEFQQQGSEIDVVKCYKTYSHDSISNETEVVSTHSYGGDNQESVDENRPDGDRLAIRCDDVTSGDPKCHDMSSGNDKKTSLPSGIVVSNYMVSADNLSSADSKFEADHKIPNNCVVSQKQTINYTSPGQTTDVNGVAESEQLCQSVRGTDESESINIKSCTRLMTSDKDKCDNCDDTTTIASDTSFPSDGVAVSDIPLPPKSDDTTTIASETSFPSDGVAVSDIPLPPNSDDTTTIASDTTFPSDRLAVSDIPLPPNKVSTYHIGTLDEEFAITTDSSNVPDIDHELSSFTSGHTLVEVSDTQPPHADNKGRTDMEVSDTYHTFSDAKGRMIVEVPDVCPQNINSAGSVCVRTIAEVADVRTIAEVADVRTIAEVADVCPQNKNSARSDCLSAKNDIDVLQGTGSANPINTEIDSDDEDAWDKIFDDNGDCLDPQMMEELSATVGEVTIQPTKINYYNYQPKDTDFDLEEYGHIIEIYDFPKEFLTRDLITSFQTFMSRGFDIKWVDDTRALGIFSSAVSANDALSMKYLELKVRPISEASKQSKQKAKRCSEFLQPYKPRPQTTALAARRLVTGALGLASKVPKEKRDEERQKLRDAKEKKKRDKKQKEDIWDGSFGHCAMDTEPT